MESFSSAGPLVSGLQSRVFARHGAHFGWSDRKIRSFALVGAATLIPTAMVFPVAPPLLTLVCLAWLSAIARTLHTLDRYARADGNVLSIDAHGILDHRLMDRRIAWQEIASICQTDTARSYVVDIRLRWPKSTLASARWPVRIGAYCQTGYGVPAVTLNMLLLDGDVADVLDAIAKYRPDLLHHSNRGPHIIRAS